MGIILGIVTQQQQQQQIDEDKLRELCSRKNVWDHFGLDREDFFIFLKENNYNSPDFILKMLTSRKTRLIRLSEPRSKIRTESA